MGEIQSCLPPIAATVQHEILPWALGSRDLGDDVLEEWQKQELTERFYRKAGTYLTPKRRPRSCPRKVRQPVSGWPRLMKNEYVQDPVTFNFV